MKKITLIFSIYLLLTSIVNGQCPNDLNTVQGTWKEDNNYFNPPFNYKANAAKYDRANAKRVLNQILGSVKQAYPNPSGCNANYDMQFPFANFGQELPYGYFLRVGFFNFYCENNLPEEIESTNVWLTVGVNSFPGTWFLSGVSPPQAGPGDSDKKFNANTDENYTISGKTVYSIPAYKSETNGTEYFAADYRGNETESAGVQYFIVKKEEAPLFIPVQRREYLVQFREELKDYESLEKTRLQNWIKIAPEDESSKNFLIRFESFMEKYQKAVDDYLTNSSAEELSKTVYELLPLIPSNTESPEVEFMEKGKSQLVYYNDKYMNPKLKDDVPQFLIIELRAEGDNGETRNKWRWELREKFSNDLDFRGLKKLLID
jgi:hypothetical protein